MSKTEAAFLRLAFPRRTFPRLVGALAACFLFIAWSGEARADVASCDVFEIKATNESTKIDAELKPLKKKLAKPPFSAWKSFKLIKKHAVKAEMMKVMSLKLAGGGKLGLLYKERSDAKGHKPRLRVVMTLDDAKGKRKAEITLKFDSGDYSLVGQDAAKDGSTSVLAIRCSVQ